MTGDSGETGRRRPSPFVLMRRHVTKLIRSLGSRKNVALARLGAWWDGTRIELGGGLRCYQRTLFRGEGGVTIGDRTTFGCPVGGGVTSSRCELQARTFESRIEIGSRVGANNGLFIVASRLVAVGDECLIGANVQIMDFDAHGVAPEERRTSVGAVCPVSIGRNVWIGNNAIILKGVSIGDNAIVAAGSVVVRGAYPADSIIGGNPAKVMRTIQA